MKKTLHVARCGVLSALLLGGMHAYADATVAAKTKAKVAPAVTAPAVAAPAPAVVAPAVAAPAVLARMGDVVITLDEYNSAYMSAARNKFYHGRAPESEVALLQREVANNLINRVLLLREAKRRGLVPDQAAISKAVEQYETKYANSEQWKKSREVILPKLTARLEEDNLLVQLEDTVRVTPEPTEDEVMAYYKANPEKFTEPERLRVSAILRKVDPAAPSDVWLKADEQLRAILKRIKEEGADFGAMARENSEDQATADKDGDMGFQHLGAMPPVAQQVLHTMKIGELTEPMQVLEGMAVLKLTDRMPARLRDFETVQVRAKQLLHRDKSDAAWTGLIADLKKVNPPQIDESRFLPLVEKSGASQAPK